MPRYCTNCGKLLIEGNSFCTGCGTPVSGQTSGQSAQPVQQPTQPIQMQQSTQAQQSVQPVQPVGVNQPTQQIQTPIQPVQSTQQPTRPIQQPIQPTQVQQPVQTAAQYTGQPMQQPYQQGMMPTQPMQQPVQMARGMANRAAGMAYSAGMNNNMIPRDAAGRFIKIEGPISTVLSGVGMFFRGIGGMFKNPKALLAALLSALVWVLALVLPRVGADVLPVRALSAITFATGGLEGGVIHRFFGYFGKGMIAASVTSLFMGGGRRIGTGFKNIGKGLSDVKGIFSFIFGMLTSCLIYFLIQGKSGMEALPAAFAGALLAVQAAGSTTGWIRSVARSWTAKKKRNVRWPNDNKANALIGGFSMGWLVAALVASLMSVVAPAAMVVYADEANTRTTVPENYKLKTKDICGEWDLNLTMSNIYSPLAAKIEETFGEGVVTYYYDENTTFSKDVKLYIAQTAPAIVEAELYADGGYHYVYRGFYRNETLKLFITKVLSEAETEDNAVTEAIERMELEFHLEGNTVVCDGTYHEGLSFVANYDMTYYGTKVGDFNGELEPLSNRDIIVQSVASTIAGDDDGTLVPATIVGVAGAMAAAGAAGAAGAATTAEGEKQEEEEQKQFKLKVYKEFGDTIRRGEKLVVYAHMVSIGKNGETEEPGLTRNIRIFSQDGIFDVDCQNELAGDYKGAWVTVSPDAPMEAQTGVINFQFVGVGGTVTNQMTFKVGKPEIILYQENIALPAMDEEGACVGFTIEGMDREICEIEVEMSQGSSYEVDYVESENVPGTYFAVLADTNTNPGEQGTYSEQTLTFRATEGELVVENFMRVYRVTTGLCIGAEALNCYRLIKKEAMTKQVQDLVASDFKIATSEIAVMFLEYDVENHHMYYRPVNANISFEPIDEQKTNTTVLQRLEGIGLQAVLKASENSVSIYEVGCTKGWLEPPTRTMAQIVATVDEEDEEGNPVHFEAKKEVLLQSQPLREHAIKTAEDERIERWIMDFRSSIYDMNIAIRIMDINDLGGELAMLDLLEDSYDVHYGYDPLLIAQIQYNVQKYIHDLQMSVLEKRQKMLVDYQEAALADANSTAMTWAHSFKMVSDKYLDNWGGMALRMGLGFVTSGASEAVFLAMDANNAVVNYYDRTPMSARNGTDAFIAGSIPVLVSGGIQAGTMLVGALIPPEVKESAKNWVVAKTGALMTPRVQNAIFAFKDAKNRFVNKLASLKSLTYDPKSKCLLITEAATKIDNVVAAGRSKALMSVTKTSAIPRTEEGKLISTLCDAGNKRGADQAGQFLKAVRGGNSAEIKAAYWGVKKDPMNSFAINKLNIAGKTKDQILAGTKVSSNARAVFTEMDDVLLQDPASKIIKREAAAAGLGSQENVVLFKGTGHTSIDGAKGYKIGLDTDVQVKIKTPNGGLKDIPAEMNTKLIGKGYCEAAGLPSATTADIKNGLKKISVEAMHKGHAEAYFELDKVLKGQAVSEASSVHNMGTRVEKIISGVKEGRNELKPLLADKAKYNRVMSESAKYAEGKIAYESLSAETKSAMASVKRIQDSMHQTNKTLNLDLGKDFKAQALGHEGTFTTKNVEFAQKCDFTEQLGNYDAGVLLDDLAAKGTSYEAEAMSMITNAHKANSLCQGVSDSVANNIINRTQQAITGGITGTINSQIQKNIGDNNQ